MIAQTLIFAVLLLIMWTIVILLVWRDGREKKKGTAMKDNDLISRGALLDDLRGSYNDLKNIYDKLHYPEEKEICKAELATFMELILRVKEAPAVDAEEAFKHLHWVKEALEMAKQSLAPVVRCENCTHQQKVWHDDKRMKEGGYFIYSCKLNDDPFVTHVVDGNPGEFCSKGKRRGDDES